MESKGRTETKERRAAMRTDGARVARRRALAVTRAPYFVIEPGSNPAKPELGHEMASEAEESIQALRIGQPL